MVSTREKGVLRMVSSSSQFAHRPLGALPHRGIQMWDLLKPLQALHHVWVTPLEQEIDQGHLHQRRLLLLEGVRNSFVNQGLPAAAAESVESCQAHIDAAVIAQ